MGKYTIDYGTKGARVLAAFGENWPEEINGEPNPQTKPDYVKQELAEMIKQRVIQYEARIAQIEAGENSLNNNNFDITLT